MNGLKATFVIYECISSLLNAYQACVLCLDFQLLEIKTNVAKESSETGYKYTYRQIYPQMGFLHEPSIGY